MNSLIPQDELDHSLRHWLYDFANQGVFLTNRDFVITGWNQWMEIHTRRPAKTILNRDLFTVYRELIQRGMDKWYRKTVNEQQVVILSQRFHQYVIPMVPVVNRPPFKQMQQTVRIAPLISKGQVVGTLSLIEDVTERVAREARLTGLYQESLTQIEKLKRSEVIIEDLNRNLEDRVLDRTEQLELANQHIQLALKEKEVLLKEIHHRVKNNLQVISSLLRLQSNLADHSESTRILRQSQNRIQSMALVHELLYQSKDISRVNFKDYVERLVSNLKNSYHGKEPTAVTLKTDVDDVQIDLDTAIPCGLIINELLSNAFKYAFPDNREGTLGVFFKKNNGSFDLIIEDNGVGLKPDTDWRHPTNTLGFQIISALSKQLKATFEMTPLAPGVRFTLKLPL